MAGQRGNPRQTRSADMMTPDEQRRMKRLEDAVRAAYCDVDDLLAGVAKHSGPNGSVQWSRTKKVRDSLKAALDDTRPDEAGTAPLVLFGQYAPLR
jgi:hypothetical protein